MEFDTLKAIIVREISGIEPENIKLESRFKEDLNMDSLDTVQVVMGIEEAFGIQVPDDAAEQFMTVGQAVEAIKAIRGE